MCPWKEFRARAGRQGIMPEEVWAAIRPHLREVQSVDFTGGGEPLLQPRLAEWVADAKLAGCETGILTNGLLLSKETAKKLLNAGLDWLCVSVDAAEKEEYEKIRVGSNFETVCRNLANIAEIRAGEVPKTMINFVMMSANFHHVEDIVRLAARLGVDQVNFKQCEVIRGEHGRDYGLFGPDETREIRRLQKNLSRAIRLARKLGALTTALSFTPRERPVCEQDPRDSAFIRYDGTVAPCISLADGGITTFLGREANMRPVTFGRVTEKDLLELWQTDGCTFFRERFENRVRAYEEAFLGGLIGDSRHTPRRLLEAAIRKMPEAPEGCRVCHYLYGI